MLLTLVPAFLGKHHHVSIKYCIIFPVNHTVIICFHYYYYYHNGYKSQYTLPTNKCMRVCTCVHYILFLCCYYCLLILYRHFNLLLLSLFLCVWDENRRERIYCFVFKERCMYALKNKNKKL